MTRPEWVKEFIEAAIKATPDIYANSPTTTTSHQRAKAKLDAMGV
jgi:hypothetical protein